MFHPWQVNTVNSNWRQIGDIPDQDCKCHYINNTKLKPCTMIDITHPTGFGPLLTAPVYSATKHGLVGFTRSIAVRDSPMRLFKKI